MTVLYETIGSVVVMTIDRPERRNAVDAETAHALFDPAKRFDADGTGETVSGATNFSGCQGRHGTFDLETDHS